MLINCENMAFQTAHLVISGVTMAIVYLRRKSVTGSGIARAVAMKAVSVVSGKTVKQIRLILGLFVSLISSLCDIFLCYYLHWLMRYINKSFNLCVSYMMVQLKPTNSWQF